MLLKVEENKLTVAKLDIAQMRNAALILESEALVASTRTILRGFASTILESLISHSSGVFPFQTLVSSGGTPFQTVVSIGGTPFQTVVSSGGTPFQTVVSSSGTPFETVVSSGGTPFRAGHPWFLQTVEIHTLSGFSKIVEVRNLSWSLQSTGST
ncbi:hypothetical protein AVEN_162125-1 [Araneus ventricosus]|uniref:Uncharacterized protein n=1 Tax=Araneus ventricosus TaxID=182803 RepID=A0A4Y2WU58_ARAVE|nr:hypothetical protein AVEN_263229-1 [Araneus ventricosus]GBO39575.1 hypothetical protein AVEN_263233-1 [Araneus ventricosus]GBO39622.1 hypothetical protein AVEN_162121-1 [Araneus ventricosus]GBO39626.1 hypothetical protein AVEN_162125-1 [Araneus ventricosus]